MLMVQCNLWYGVAALEKFGGHLLLVMEEKPEQHICSNSPWEPLLIKDGFWAVCDEASSRCSEMSFVRTWDPLPHGTTMAKTIRRFCCNLAASTGPQLSPSVHNKVSSFPNGILSSLQESSVANCCRKG